MNLICFFLKITDDPGEIKEILRGILRQSQFSGLKPGKFSMFMNKLIESLKSSKFFKGLVEILIGIVQFLAGLFSTTGWFLYVFLFIVLGGMLIFLYFSIKRKISRSVTKIDSEMGEAGSIDPNTREKQGLTAAKRGEFLRAIRHLYISLLLLFNSRGILEFDNTRTNRETQRKIEKAGTDDLCKSFSCMNRIFEDKVYALEPCEKLDYDSFHDAYISCKKGIRKL
ncbi:MAG: hypothetical protein K8T10_18090 [Candidatus Eremiobacteraeota bacterium]|nr:hypothetical protein [Candidatus Eremiobacteraeota bacterium]